MDRAVDRAAAIHTSSSSNSSSSKVRGGYHQKQHTSKVAFTCSHSPGLHGCCCFWLLRRIALCELLQARAMVVDVLLLLPLW